ncbi:hypothetical protein ACN47E_002615 [Coniothyrium glycines]
MAERWQIYFEDVSDLYASFSRTIARGVEQYAHKAILGHVRGAAFEDSDDVASMPPGPLSGNGVLWATATHAGPLQLSARYPCTALARLFVDNTWMRVDFLYNVCFLTRLRRQHPFSCHSALSV